MSTIQMIRDKHVLVPNADMKTLKEEAATLARRAQTVLPAEKSLATWMNTRMQEIQQEVSAHQAFSDSGFKPILDQSVLRWRYGFKLRKLPVPKVILVDPFNGGTTTFSRETHTSGVWSAYKDIVEAIQERTNDNRRQIRLAFTYDGVIPNDVRDLIHEERPKYERIYLLVESPFEAWRYSDVKVTIRERIAQLDPLVLGLTASNQLVMLAQYDPTPLEAYISNEFATRQLTAGS